MNLMNRNPSAIHTICSEHGATHSPALAHVVFNQQLYRRDADLSESYTGSMEFEAVMIVAKVDSARILLPSPRSTTTYLPTSAFQLPLTQYLATVPRARPEHREKKKPPGSRTHESRSHSQDCRNITTTHGISPFKAGRPLDDDDDDDEPNQGNEQVRRRRR